MSFQEPSAAIEGLFMGNDEFICEIEETALNGREKGMGIFQRTGMRIRYTEPGHMINI